MIASSYTGLKGEVYKPGSLVGQGGEGAVYEIAGKPMLVMKVYTEFPDVEKAEKLRFMATYNDAELLKYAA